MAASKKLVILFQFDPPSSRPKLGLNLGLEEVLDV